MPKSVFVLVVLSLAYIVIGVSVLNAKDISYLPYNAEPELSKSGEYNKIERDSDIIYLPKVAFGTDFGGIEKGKVKSILLGAIKDGFRVFDTATQYETACILAEAIKDSEIPREKFFIIYKYCMIPSILVDNDTKQLEHVDVLMDHFADKPDDKCLKYIKSQIDDKKIAFFGVSNITIFQIPDYTQKGFPKISFVQNQFNPFREDVMMRGYCKENKIIYMGYAILGGGDGACGHYYSYGKLQSQLEALALAYKDASKGAILTTQQLLLAWAYSQIEMLIVRSSDAKRIEQNKEGHIRKNVRDVHKDSLIIHKNL